MSPERRSPATSPPPAPPTSTAVRSAGPRPAAPAPGRRLCSLMPTSSWLDVLRFLRRTPAELPLAERRRHRGFWHEVADDEFIGWLPPPPRAVRPMLGLAEI